MARLCEKIVHALCDLDPAFLPPRDLPVLAGQPYGVPVHTDAAQRPYGVPVYTSPEGVPQWQGEELQQHTVPQRPDASFQGQAVPQRPGAVVYEHDKENAPEHCDEVEARRDRNAKPEAVSRRELGAPASLQRPGEVRAGVCEAGDPNIRVEGSHCYCSPGCKYPYMDLIVGQAYNDLKSEPMICALCGEPFEPKKITFSKVSFQFHGKKKASGVEFAMPYPSTPLQDQVTASQPMTFDLDKDMPECGVMNTWLTSSALRAL